MTKKNMHSRTALIFLDIGWKISIPLIILVIVGALIDKQFNTKPLFIIIGIVLSIIFNSYTFYRLYKKITKDQT